MHCKGKGRKWVLSIHLHFMRICSQWISRKSMRRKRTKSLLLPKAKRPRCWSILRVISVISWISWISWINALSQAVKNCLLHLSQNEAVHIHIHPKVEDPYPQKDSTGLFRRLGVGALPVHLPKRWRQRRSEAWRSWVGGGGWVGGGDDPTNLKKMAGPQLSFRKPWDATG